MIEPRPVGPAFWISNSTADGGLFWGVRPTTVFAPTGKIFDGHEDTLLCGEDRQHLPWWGVCPANECRRVVLADAEWLEELEAGLSPQQPLSVVGAEALLLLAEMYAAVGFLGSRAGDSVWSRANAFLDKHAPASSPASEKPDTQE